MLWLLLLVVLVVVLVVLVVVVVLVLVLVLVVVVVPVLVQAACNVEGDQINKIVDVVQRGLQSKGTYHTIRPR